MKYKTLIIIIMAIALTISTTYSIVISKNANKAGENKITTKSIIEMKATTVTIKNTLTGMGNVQYKEKIKDSNIDVNVDNNDEINQENEIDINNQINENEEIQKSYQIVLLIDEKDLKNTAIGNQAEISIKKEEETLNYLGEVKFINKIENNKSQLIIEIINYDEKIQENMQATCTVIIDKAENVVALPIEAIQKDENGEEYVDIVMQNGTTSQVKIKTGISDDYYVEITSGLNVGDRVQIIKSSVTVINEKEKTSKK